jgi:hypothetical protein
MRLSVKLCDSFTNNTVTVVVDEKEVYRKSGITTNLIISFEVAVKVPIKKFIVKLKVGIVDIWIEF